MPTDRRRRSEAKMTFTVLENVPCFRRPAGGSEWAPYTTTEVTVFPHFAWQTASLFGFYKDGYEWKVMRKFVYVAEFE